MRLFCPYPCLHEGTLTHPQSQGQHELRPLLSRPYGLQAVNRWKFVWHAQLNVDLCHFIGSCYPLIKLLIEEFNTTFIKNQIIKVTQHAICGLIISKLFEAIAF